MSQSIQCNMRKNHENTDKQCHNQSNATWGRPIRTQINNDTIYLMQNEKEPWEHNNTMSIIIQSNMRNNHENTDKQCHNQSKATWERFMRTQIKMSLSIQCNMRNNYENSDIQCHNQSKATWERSMRTQINNVTINPMQHEEEPWEHR